MSNIKIHDNNHGLSAIKEWNETTGKKYELTLAVISAVEENGGTVVT